MLVVLAILFITQVCLTAKAITVLITCSTQKADFGIQQTDITVGKGFGSILLCFYILLLAALQ